MLPLVSDARRLAESCDVLVGWGEPPRGAPAIVTSHWDGSSTFGRELLEKCSGAHALVAVSRSALEAFPAAHRGRAEIIYNGVDQQRVVPTRSRSDIRREFGIADGAKVLGYLGRISTEKRVGAVVRAVARLPRDWVGLIVGDGSARAKLQRAIKRHGKRRVILSPPRPDVGNVLAAFDRLVLPSRGEGFGLVVAEAWLARVPVIATRVGIVREQPELAQLVTGTADDSLGRAIAAAAPSADAGRTERAFRFASERLTAKVFGERWSSLLRSTGRE